MFGRRDLVAERVDLMQETLTVVENTVGINLPRIATLENRFGSFVKRMDGLEEKFDREIRRRRLDLDSPEPPGAIDVGMLPMLPAPAGTIQEQALRNPTGPPLELGPGPPRREIDLSKALGPLDPVTSPTPEPSRGRPLNKKEGFRQVAFRPRTQKATQHRKANDGPTP